MADMMSTAELVREIIEYADDIETKKKRARIVDGRIVRGPSKLQPKQSGGLQLWQQKFGEARAAFARAMNPGRG